MSHSVNRRQFLGAAAGTAAFGVLGAGKANAQPDSVRVGIIGTGNRGTALLRILLKMDGVQVPAICDIDTKVVERAVGLISEAGQPAPKTYTRDEHHYKDLCTRDDLDAVIVATPWQWHAPMAVDAMKAGKYAGVEVPAAITVDECWQLVDTSEETGVPCMMLENWSFRRDNLAVLNMVREGLFGEIMHTQGCYGHDCRHWFFSSDGSNRWPGGFMAKRNCDQYPTHGEGPILSWMDINCGDAFDYVTSTATAQRGIHAWFKENLGPDHPKAQEDWPQGDMVHTIVRTKQGKSIAIVGDMQLPRPYDNRWLLQGTGGIYSHEHDAVFIAGRSPKDHEWEPFPPYIDEFDHVWWRTMGEKAMAAGHGGTDYIELKLFLDAVRHKTQPPIDVYDSATMSSIVGLSEASIAKGSAPVDCPDFTRGKWQTRKPAFGLQA
ncbi:MAG: Gfo/Idh/MocA family protein [Candidatus Hydrogenedentota bacterium]